MFNSLYEALQADVNAYPANDLARCQVYVRSLLSDAYLVKEGNLGVHRYAKAVGRERVQQEIHDLAPRCQYLDNGFSYYEQLLADVAYTITPTLLEAKMRKVASPSVSSPTSPTSPTLCTSFMDVMHKTLDYHALNGQLQKDNADMVTRYSHLILSNYFQKGAKVFSRSNGTRAYVLSLGKDAIVREMREELGILPNVPLEELITSYSIKAATSFLSNTDFYNSDFEMGGRTR